MKRYGLTVCPRGIISTVTPTASPKPEGFGLFGRRNIELFQVQSPIFHALKMFSSIHGHFNVEDTGRGVGFATS